VGRSREYDTFVVSLNENGELIYDGDHAQVKRCLFGEADG
jgi:hypothetical protein